MSGIGVILGGCSVVRTVVSRNQEPEETTERNAKINLRREGRRGERGAKAYAPFGAGRETGHQIPAVAAKLKGKRRSMTGRIVI